MGIDIGPLHVRRNSFIEASPESVWAEFTSFERIAAWYGHGHTLQEFAPAVGSTVRLSVEIDGALSAFGGPILVFEQGREMTYESNWFDQRAWPVPTYHTFRLTALHSGTHIEIFHHGFERLGADAGNELEGYEAGWNSQHLERLRAIVERTC